MILMDLNEEADRDLRGRCAKYDEPTRANR